VGFISFRIIENPQKIVNPKHSLLLFSRRENAERLRNYLQLN